MSDPRIFRYFKTSPEIIRLAVMIHLRYPLWLRVPTLPAKVWLQFDWSCPSCLPP